MEKTLAYTSIPEGDTDSGCESRPLESSHEQQTRFKPTTEFRRRNLILIVQVAILLASILFSVVGVVARSSNLRSKPCPKCYVDDEQCTQHLSSTSPIIDAGIIEYRWQTLSNGFGSDSIYRGPPTYDRENAWEALENWGAITISSDKIKQLNKTESKQWLKTSGNASGGYAAYLEVHHQLYCLAALRRWTYKDEFLASMGELPELFHGTVDQVHKRLDNCIESLRLSLMCTSDVTPILFRKDSAAEEGFKLDLGTKHKCRNYDRIVQWEMENQATEFDGHIEDFLDL